MIICHVCVDEGSRTRAQVSMGSWCAESDRDAGIVAVDSALDEFLAAPSASPNDLLFKLRALGSEYGLIGSRGTSGR